MHVALLNRGCLIAPFHNMMLISPATTKKQVDRLIAAFDEVLTELFSPRENMTQDSPSGSSIAEAEAFLAAHPEIEAFDIVLHDSNGIGRGKIIRRHELLSIYKGGRHLPMSILGLDICGEDVHETGLVWDQGDGDRRGWPIPGTLIRPSRHQPAARRSADERL